jgi:hypothetical protein
MEDLGKNIELKDQEIGEFKLETKKLTNQIEN